MTLTLRHRRIYPAPRLFATLLAISILALGITVSPAASGIAHASDCTFSASECVAIGPKSDTSVVMNVEGSGTSNGDRVRTGSPQSDAPAPNEQWHFAANDDGTFQIVNNNSAKCLDVTTPTHLGLTTVYSAYQWDCSNSDGQKFYAEPAGDSIQDYRLRQASSDQCLTFFAGEVELRDCTSGDDAVWNIATFDAGSSIRELAATYAIGVCGEDATSCDLDETGATFTKGEPVCVLNYHNTNDTEAPEQSHTLTETVANASMTGEETTTGETGGVALESPFLKFKAEFTKSWKSTVQSTTTNTSAGGNTYYTAKVEPHSYAWILATPVTKNYTGNFTFNPNEWNEWSYSADSPISVPVPADENGNSTLVTAGSGPDSDPNNECGGNHPTEFTGSSAGTEAPPGAPASTTPPVG
ncbi:RICIN domain-containing protein [Streptomyces platensis]|uniref:RICIN domain-containing protein n=1 Tax=Streptomyces platensis TaxID=58346 RepID=UPI001F283AC3|nr:RICIN domain-containing protein [Streptomyces platensis]MCF3144176.1 RICIN domain-containing protein [Streptomyces platensis]